MKNETCCICGKNPVYRTKSSFGVSCQACNEIHIERLKQSVEWQKENPWPADPRIKKSTLQ